MDLFSPQRRPEYFNSTPLRAPIAGELTVATSMAHLVNGGRIIVGMSKSKSGELCACSWDDKFRPTLLEMPEVASGSAAIQVNSRGDVLGYAKGKFSDQQTLGILWNAQGANILSPLKGDDSTEPTSMNSKGLIVGMSHHSMVAVNRVPVIWFQLEPTSLPLPNGSRDGQAMSINESGIIVGSASEAGSDHYPIAWIKNNPIRLPDDDLGGLALRVTNSNLVLGFIGAGDDIPMCLWDISRYVSGGDYSDIRRYNIGGTLSINVEAQSATVFERDGTLHLMLDASKAGRLESYHFPLLIKSASLDELATSRSRDLNELAPGVIENSHLHSAYLTSTGAVLAQGRRGQVPTAVLLERIIN